MMLNYPSCMAGYFARYGLEPLQLAEESQPCTVGIYLMREKADAPHVVQMQELLHQFLEPVRHLVS